MKRCHKCGEKLEDKALFCPKCGEYTDGTEEEVTEEDFKKEQAIKDELEEKRQRSNSVRYVESLLMFPLVAAFMIFMYYCVTHDTRFFQELYGDENAKTMVTALTFLFLAFSVIMPASALYKGIQKKRKFVIVASIIVIIISLAETIFMITLLK